MEGKNKRYVVVRKEDDGTVLEQYAEEFDTYAEADQHRVKLENGYEMEIRAGKEVDFDPNEMRLEVEEL